MTKNGKLISMCPVSASSRSVMVRSMPRNDSTEISRSPCKISTKRDMCVPLKLCGRLTYMLKLAMVCCSPADRSLTRTGWLMSLMPTRLMGSSRVSRRACTSSTSVTAVRASLAVASGAVMRKAYRKRPEIRNCIVRDAAVPRNTSFWVACAAGALRPAGGAQAFRRLQRPPALDARAESGGVESGGAQTPLARAVLDEAVGNAELQYRQLQTLGGEHLEDRGASPAVRGVLLDGHERAMPRGERHHQILIEWLDEAHVDERGVEGLRDRLRRRQQRAERQQRQPALALAPQLRLADRQRGELRAHRGSGTCAARIAHDCRAVERARGVQHLPALVLVRRRHDHGVGNAAQEAQIVAALVSRAIAADEAGAVHRKHDRQLLQRHVVNELIVGALQERRVDRHHRLQAVRGHPRGEGHRMLLGDRDVEIAIGETLGELDQAGALAHRRRDGNDAWIALRHVAQPLAEDLRIGGTGALLLKDRTAHRVERPGPMPLDRVGFGGCVALALARHDVQQLRSTQLAEVAQRADQRLDVVTVHGH